MGESDRQFGLAIGRMGFVPIGRLAIGVEFVTGEALLRPVLGIHRGRDGLAAAAVAACGTASTAPTAAAALLLGLRILLGTGIRLEQGLPVGDGDLVIVRVDLAERQ